jgi:hypothetical protein
METYRKLYENGEMSLNNAAWAAKREGYFQTFLGAREYILGTWNGEGLAERERITAEQFLG